MQALKDDGVETFYNLQKFVELPNRKEWIDLNIDPQFKNGVECYTATSRNGTLYKKEAMQCLDWARSTFKGDKFRIVCRTISQKTEVYT